MRDRMSCQRRVSASRIAPSRRPHSLTTNRPTASSDATVARTAAPTGSSGARSCLHPGQRQSGSQVEPGQVVGELHDLMRRQLDLVHLTGSRRRPPPGTRRGQPGQGAHGSAADHGAGGDAGVVRHGPADGLERVPGPDGERHPVGHRQGVARAQLSTQARRADRGARGQRQTLRVPHRRFEAPAAEVQPEHGAVPGPDAGTLPDETEPGLFFSSQDEHLRPDDAAPGARRPRRRWRRRAVPRWPGRPRCRPGPRSGPPADAWPPPPRPRPGRGGSSPRCPDTQAEVEQRLRCRTGVSVSPGPASHTSRWKELLPRSQTAARTPTART